MLLLLAASCAYQAPVDTASDYTPGVTLTGDVVYSADPFEPGVGHVLVYSADNLPPPNGLGRPVDFTTVARDDWEGDAAGLRSAPWAISGLGSGSYLVTALVDNDEDFNPFFDFTGGATCGDTVGAWLDGLSTQSPAVLTVEAPDRVDGLSVVAASTLPIERPAFTPAGFSLNLPVGPNPEVPALSRTNTTDTQFLYLSATGIEHPLLSLNAPDSTYCPARFYVTLNDADGDGEVDPHTTPELAALGLKDVWPKVYLIYAANLQGLTPEEDPDMPDDEVWVSEAVVLPDLFLPPFGSYAAGDALLSDSLAVVFLPAARRMSTGELVYGADMPAGLWLTLVVEPTGQTWLVPNQSGDADLAASAGWEAIPGQGVESLIPIQ